MGGDRDGHPYVTADVTNKHYCVSAMRPSIAHLEYCDRVYDFGTVSSDAHEIDPQIIKDLEEAETPLARICRITIARSSV